jgi:hypothetical protein
MPEGKTGDTVKKRDDRRTRIEALLVRPPRLKGTAGHVQSLSCLTLREALGLQVAILRKSLRTFDAIPALVALIIATLRILDDCAHRYLLLLTPLSWCTSMAKDGEGALLVQPFTRSNQ